jgi:hypothetical protein
MSDFEEQAPVKTTQRPVTGLYKTETFLQSVWRTSGHHTDSVELIKRLHSIRHSGLPFSLSPTMLLGSMMHVNVTTDGLQKFMQGLHKKTTAPRLSGHCTMIRTTFFFLSLSMSMCKSHCECNG